MMGPTTDTTATTAEAVVEVVVVVVVVAALVVVVYDSAANDGVIDSIEGDGNLGGGEESTRGWIVVLVVGYSSGDSPRREVVSTAR